jgi:hypothetical protein
MNIYAETATLQMPVDAVLIARTLFLRLRVNPVTAENSCPVAGLK